MFWQIVSGCISDCVSSKEIDGKQKLDETKQDLTAELETEKSKQQSRSELTAKCFHMKVHRAKDGDFEEIVKKFHENEIRSDLNRIKLIEDQWRTLELSELLQSVNPRPIIKFDEKEINQRNESLLENTPNYRTLRRSVALCCIFEDMMKNFGWKDGDTLDIEDDICYVVGQVMMTVDANDMSNLMECMQSAMMNIQAHVSERDDDMLSSLLMTKKKYNGLNLACILLEQMILDNIDSNVSWMRIVCIQFIDLVCQLLIIKPKYRAEIRWNLNYLMMMEPKWTVADVFNLTKNGLLMFQRQPKKFNQYLIIIRNWAIHPSLRVRISNNENPVSFEHVVRCRDERKWECLNVELLEDEDKSLEQVLSELKVEQVLSELKEGDLRKEEQESIIQIIGRYKQKLREYKYECEISVNSSEIQSKKQKDMYKQGIDRELNQIKNSENIDRPSVDVLSSCLAVTSMAVYICKGSWPYNTQLMSYCLLLPQRTNKKGRLLEILTGEGKSRVIAMVAATYALLGRKVDIVTSSAVLSQRDEEEWRTFYETLKLNVGCNVEDNREGDNQCYKCPIVYGTVETFARDILKTEFFLQDVRESRTCDIVIVDEVDSMMIDQSVQCTYLCQNIGSSGMHHFNPILCLIWMHVNRFVEFQDNGDMVWYRTEFELFFVTLSRISDDPLHILRQVEQESGITKGFTDQYLKSNIEGQIQLSRSLSYTDVKTFFSFAQKYLNVDIDIYIAQDAPSKWEGQVNKGISILAHKDGLSSVVLTRDMVEDGLKKMMTDVLSEKMETGIKLPIYLREYCNSRLRHWIDNAFHAQNMRLNREYVIRDGAVYPVDFESTGIIELNKKWGDGLQQFLEMKHNLPVSPISLITNFLSNVDFFDRYIKHSTVDACSILGVSGTLGTTEEKKLMSEAFLVDFATIPTSKRRKLFELDGLILEDEKKWLSSICIAVESVIKKERAALVICEDIATAVKIRERSPWKMSKRNIRLHTDSCHSTPLGEEMNPGDVVITTNLGARGTDFKTDEIVNNNGGLFVLVTFIPLKDRVEKQAFGRTGRRGTTGSCQIIVNRRAMPVWLRECETVDEAKHLREYIEKHRLGYMTEVKKMRNKQELFREYCELKKEFVNVIKCDSDDLKVQVEILDETWAKWMQSHEEKIKGTNEMVQKLPQMSEDGSERDKQVKMVLELRHDLQNCSEKARQLESDNIYHILKCGAVRLQNDDFEEAITFYDRVIHVDPTWSAFAHYNRAYCTLKRNIKKDGYVRHAIDDLNATRHKLETFKWTSLFSEIHGYRSAVGTRLREFEFNSTKEQTITIPIKYPGMIECQLLQHIDAHIIDTIQKLETMDTTKEEVATGMILRRKILDLIPEMLLEEFSQLGFLFTFNILEEPVFCFSSQIVSSHLPLWSAADTILTAFFSGILVKCDSLDLRDMIKDVCNIGYFGDDNSSRWMSQCVSRAIVTGIHSIHYYRCVNSVVPTKRTEIDSVSNSKISDEDQFIKFAQTQAKYVLNELVGSMLRTMTCEKKLTGSIRGVIPLQTTNDVMTFIKEKIKQTTQDNIIFACSPILKTLSFCIDTHFNSLPRSKSESMKMLLRRLKELHTDPKKSPLMRLMIESRIISTYCECNIIILDVDKEIILRISKPECDKTRELIYNPPSRAYPNGHFKTFINGEVAEFSREKISLFNLNNDVDYCLFQAVNSLHENIITNVIISYIDEHPRRNGEMFASEYYRYQLKQGRALLRLDVNHPAPQINQHELDSLHDQSCIELASSSENASQLAEFLSECESKLRSAGGNSSLEHGTEKKASPVSEDACNFFLFSGKSVEAEVYRQLVVERINENDITTALMLCCIGHQMPFCREIGNIRISDEQTLSDTFNQMLNIEYEREINTFLSICDEWYNVLKPQGMMNIRIELLREWIKGRKYANTEDPVVILCITECSKHKREEVERKRQEAERKGSLIQL